MSDQAARLRELVMAADTPPASAAGARIVAVSGATQGLGATTVATQLSIALIEHYDNVLLVDTHLEKSCASGPRASGHRASEALENPERGSLADVLAGRRTMAEVAQLGPDGIRLLPIGPNGPKGGQMPHVNLAARDRLLNELRRSAGPDQLVVVNTGPGLTPWTEPLWSVAQTVLVVTTPDPRAITNTVSMLQLAARSDLLSAVRLVVNRCESPLAAEQVHQQIGQICYRQFNELLPAMPALPISDHLGIGKSHRSEHRSETMQAMRELASTLVGEAVNKRSAISSQLSAF